MWKFISENRLILACATIFLLSIFLRSIIDIGPDTGIYLSLGQKVAEGKRYYYDFFESNFPLSFYFYALQYKISIWSGINQIILSELVINSLALLSILWSARILKRSKIYQNKSYYDLLIIAYFLGFFLRPYGLSLGEFGTKTSLFLILLYPYLSYSFAFDKEFNNRDLLLRGILIGLMPCLKPHYLVFPLLIELYKAYQNRSIKSLFTLDKLIAIAIYFSYLLWMIKFTPEFFEMMVPMWLKVYGSYESKEIFVTNLCKIFASHIGVFTFIFLIFTKLKISNGDDILVLSFIAAALMVVLENAITIDQIVIFYAIITICVTKFAFDFFSSSVLSIVDNKFILGALFIIPAFDLGIVPVAIFGLGGIINSWWILAPIIMMRDRVFLLIYLILVIAAIIVIRFYGNWPYIAFNLAAAFGIFFLHGVFAKKDPYVPLTYGMRIPARRGATRVAFPYPEGIKDKKDLNKNKFSPFVVFLIASSISSLFYVYVADISNAVKHKYSYTFPNDISDMMNYYSKQFAPQKSDGFITISRSNSFNFSRLNYLQKENYQKFHTASVQARSSSNHNGLMFDINDVGNLFVSYYLFDDIKTAIKNPRTKIVFVNNSNDILSYGNGCLIGYLEYYFLDPEFKKFFLKNFRFENHIIIKRDFENLENISLITGVKPSIFDQVTKSKQQIVHDFEVYIRQ